MVNFPFNSQKKKNPDFSEITAFGVAWNWELLEQEQADRCMYQQDMLVIHHCVLLIFLQNSVKHLRLTPVLYLK
jgi:hypothetical protein